MAAEIVAMETPTGVEEETLVETEVVLVEAFTSQASRLDVMNAGTPARFRLNQTEASRFSVKTVSEAATIAVIHGALTVLHRLVDSTTVAIDLRVVPQDQLLWAQA